MGDDGHTTREWLLQELDRVRAHKTELEGHRREEARLVRELAEVERALADHGHVPKRLPLLDSMRVASPCHVAWDSMTGDARTRHCRSCDKTVHDISAMSRESAEAFLQRAVGTETCVRFYRRADGTVLTQGDCPTGVRTRRRKVLLVAAGASLVGVGAGFATLWALEPPPQAECPLPAVMGAMAVPSPGPAEVTTGLLIEPEVAPSPGLPGELERYTDANGIVRYREIPAPKKAPAHKR